MKKSLSLCLSSMKNLAQAKKIARHLIRKKLAACVNIIPKVTSVYEWQDKIYEDAEVMLLIKTPTGNVKRLKAEVLALHPYEVPEFVVLKSTDVSSAYFGWAKKNTRFSR